LHGAVERGGVVEAGEATRETRSPRAGAEQKAASAASARESGRWCDRATSRVQAAARAGRKALPGVASWPSVADLAMRSASSARAGDRPRRVAMEVMPAEATASFWSR
jgi:hypothetical protein